MKFTINGLMAPTEALKLFKAMDAPDVPVRVIASDGAPTDLTAVTATIEVYAAASRSTAAVASLAVTVVTAAAGAAKFVPTVAAVNFGPGTYYMFAKTVTAGVIDISDNYVTLKVG